ncbi:MAG: NGG1p interacting factor NIF3 [Candidatus Omnitrophica bacterium]|nr:NGG1p interacting factor NIF3 [Candidatus Omnitrophota bacterium]
MKLQELFDKAVEKGMSVDPRGKKVVKECLETAKKEYKKLGGFEKKYFSKEKFTNPYSDTRMLYGKGNEEIRTVMVGVDIECQEMVLADRLRQKGVKIDLVIAHHPEGKALAHLDKVMAIQPDLWHQYGLDKTIAKKIMEERMQEVFRGVSVINQSRAVDAARLLGIPLICCHTVADNCVTSYLQKFFDGKKPKKLTDVLNLLVGVPEYRYAAKTLNVCPYIASGENKSEAGKIFVDMTGGTSGPDKIFSRLSQAGIKTIVGMHVKESGLKAAKSEYMNYVIAGHISSDNLGLNLLFDSVDPKGKLNFIECSGFKRFRRI